MEKKINYKELYKLQDDVLDLIFSLENNFFLTGGTALHRFYYNLRFSDDLDFFTHNDRLFSENINELLDCFEDKNLDYKRIVQSKDFQRVLFKDKLQIDFVNDKVYREGKSVLFGKFKIDNKINILTNKLCAILDRDEEKDVFDLVAIATYERFDWDTILEIANKKSNVDRAVLIERLKTFPLEWLDNIKSIVSFTINKDMLTGICRDIENSSEVSYEDGN